MTRKRFSEKVRVLLAKNIRVAEIADRLGVSFRVIAHISKRGEAPGNFNCCVPSCKKELVMDSDLRTRFCEKHAYVSSLSGRDRNREMVRIRDKHTCQACLRVWTPGTRRFDCHHLKGLCGKSSREYDKSQDINSLITLCHKCHLNQPHVKAKMNKTTTREIKKEHILGMIRDRKNNMSYGKIAKKYGLSYPTTRKILMDV